MSTVIDRLYCVQVETIGARVAAERNAMGLSQEAFAEICKLSRGGIAKIEGDKNVPNAVTLFAISRATGKPMEYFVSGQLPKTELRELTEIAEFAETMASGLMGWSSKLRQMSGQTPQTHAKVVNLLDRRRREWKHAGDQRRLSDAERVAESASEYVAGLKEEGEDDDEGTGDAGLGDGGSPD